LTGFFQADSVIADHTLPGHCDIVFGSDAGFSFLAGRNCLQVHEFKYLWKTESVATTIELRSTNINKSYPFEEVHSENDKVHKKKRKATATFNVPDNDGTKARPVTPNKGLSNERGQVRILRELSNLTNQDARAWTQTVQQMSQLADPDSPDLCNLSENLLKESGLSPHAANYGDWGERAKLQTTPTKSLPQPTFTPFSISDGAVKARTGFVSMFSLLSSVVVVCNGDVVQMMKKKSSMT
jgi:hypothetical protein